MTFVNRLRVPPLLDPGAGPDGVTRFDLALQTGRTGFLPGKPASTWGVNGSYLGDTTVWLAVEFGRYTDPKVPYMYHCHILRHEDSGMMGQFVIVPPGTEDSVQRVITMSGNGHRH